MAAKAKKAPAKKKAAPKPARAWSVAEAVAALKAAGTKTTRDGYARYGIVAPKSFGVTLANIQAIAKQIGRDHALALKLWDAEWYEARLLCAFIADPARVTPAEMDRWRADFDNWGICDTVCFKLWDQTPDVFDKIAKWARLNDEFGKRAAFALLASAALHRRGDGDVDYAKCLPLIEKAATDDRNFVKKGVNWALRAIGGRSRALNAEAVALSRKLAASDNATARWVGKDALKALTGPATLKRLKR